MSTIRQIAREAKVSTGTVSNVLNGHPNVSEETRERVMEAIRRNNYRPSAIARGLATRRTGIVGIVISNFSNPFYTELVQGAIEAARDHECQLLVTGAAHDGSDIQSQLDTLLRKWVDGIFLAAQPLSAELLAGLHIGETPLVVMDYDAPQLDTTVGLVSFDWESAAYQATHHLVELGHRRIGYVGGISNRSSTRMRDQGYFRALADAGIPYDPDLHLSGDFRTEGGLLAARQLLQNPQRPTALVMANDLMAIGAYQAAAEFGLAIPHALSIVGMDDIPFAGFLSPPLTSVHVPSRQVGYAGLRMLMETSSGNEELQHMVFPTHLVARNSTAAVSGAGVHCARNRGPLRLPISYLTRSTKGGVMQTHARMTRRALLQWMGMTMAGSTLAACVAPTAPGTTATGGESSSAEVVTVRFQSEMTDARGEQFVNDFFPIFEELNPGIHIQHEPVPWGEYLDKLRTTAAAGTLADTYSGNARWHRAFIVDNMAASLQAYIDASATFDWADIPEAIRPIWTDPDGEVYGMPFEIWSRLIIANRRLFDEAGIELPDDTTWTHDDLLEIAKALTMRDADGKASQWGYFNMPPSGDVEVYPAWLWPNQAHEMSEDLRQATLNSPESIAVHQKYVGLRNYQELVQDPLFWRSLWNTVYYTLGHLPLNLLLALIIALLLNQPIRGVSIFRAGFYLPSVFSGVAVSLIWLWIFNPQVGLINSALRLVGIEGPGWIYDRNWAIHNSYTVRS